MLNRNDLIKIFAREIRNRITEADIDFGLETLESALRDMLPVIAAEAPELLR